MVGQEQAPATLLLCRAAQVATSPHGSGFALVYGFPWSPAFKNLPSATLSSCPAPPQLQPIPVYCRLLSAPSLSGSAWPGAKGHQPEPISASLDQARRKRQEAHFASGEPGSCAEGSVLGLTRPTCLVLREDAATPASLPHDLRTTLDLFGS